MERVRELSQKAHDGVLTQDEERELDTYLTVGSVLEVLKAKAGLAIRRAGGRSPVRSATLPLWMRSAICGSASAAARFRPPAIC
jgi:hypothetical protein